MQGELETLDTQIFDSINKLGIGLPKCSTNLAILNDYKRFKSSYNISDSVLKEEDFANISLNNPFNPGKSRYYSCKEIGLKIQKASKIIKCNNSFRIKLLGCNTFLISRK